MSKNNCGSVFAEHPPRQQDYQARKCIFSCLSEYPGFQAVYAREHSSMRNLHVLKLHKYRLSSRFHLTVLQEVYFLAQIRPCKQYTLLCKDHLPYKPSDSSPTLPFAEGK